MKVSIDWLKELVDLKTSVGKLIQLLPLRSVSIKQLTADFIELDMKGYNRADLLSMRGVAIEVAAITDSSVKFSDDELTFDQNIPHSKVKVENLELVPIYCIAKVENLKVEQSSDRWIKKLSGCGIRAVNNIADVTNLVMLEYGQPMHAFDARAVKDEAIIVRCAKGGERITTLDGKTRDLETLDLLIADSLNALGIAGVMGGKDSEITESTTTILLEAAIFDPFCIRKTATRLGLQSEASKRFQHGLTKKRLFQALDAAIKMYQSLGGKLISLSIMGDVTDPVRKVNLTENKLNSLVGIDFNSQQVEEYLKKLGFSLVSQNATINHWEVTVPYWRGDIGVEEDLIEEVTRMYGYENIPAVKVKEIKLSQDEDPIFKTIYNLRGSLSELGLTEVQTYSFYSTDVLISLGFNESNINTLTKVANPISSETEYLRMNVWPNLIEVVSRNFRKEFRDIAIFEIGKTYSNNEGGIPKEEYRLSIALFNGSDNPLAELYKIAENLCLHLKGRLKQTIPPQNSTRLFHPKRFFTIEKENKSLGEMFEVHLKVLDKLGIDKRVAVLEIKLN